MAVPECTGRLTGGPARPTAIRAGGVVSVRTMNRMNRSPTKRARRRSIALFVPVPYGYPVVTTFCAFRSMVNVSMTFVAGGRVSSKIAEV